MHTSVEWPGVNGTWLKISKGGGLLDFIVDNCVSYPRNPARSINSFTMSQKHAPPTGASSTGMPWFNFPGYNDHGLISAAILIPPNRRIVCTSGQVGTDSNGKQPESLEDEMIVAFEVISPDLLPTFIILTTFQ
jgi:hypothetical protein